MPKIMNGREIMDVMIMYNVPITTRDGVTLYADVYRPNNNKPYPAVINRTPYLKDGVAPLAGYFRANLMAGCGYNVVIQDVRGTGHSEGICDPAGHQDEDGYDTIEAIAEMPWCDGNVAMMGESYHGFSQLACARANPPHLKAICPFMTSWTKFPAIYDFGVFSPVLYGWIIGRALDRLKYFPDQYSPEAVVKMQSFNMNEQVAWLPMKDMPAGNVEGVPELQFHKDLLANIDNKDYLRFIGRVEGFEETTVPTLNLTGWNDFLRDKTIYNYTQFRDRGGSEACRKGSKLIIGPWAHGDRLEGWIEGTYYGPEGSGDDYGVTEKLVQWFDHWCKGIETDFTSGAPIKLFVMGSNIWRDEYEWPLARTKFTDFYLHSGGKANTLHGDGTLSVTPAEEEPADYYDYDPMDPCPSGTNESQKMIMQNQALIQRRNDVLVYTTPTFTEETEITGPIHTIIYASTSARDTDFCARVSVVRKDGTVYKLGSLLVRGRYRNGEKPEAMIPGKIYKFEIKAANTSIILQPGEAIRLDVTSSLFPDADRNLNTFGRVGYEAEGIIAHQTIYHDRHHPSRLILPVIPKS
ncbi:MAG: CocE/NonD family hydrolase [Christensenellales bacterium]|jgi:putative CocE/NonD family hydrolase